MQPLSTPPVPLAFIVAGFSKCGSTTLAELLGEHPELAVPRGKHKEPEFFLWDDYLDRWGDYARFFRSQRGQILGEASIAYSSVPNAPVARARILQHFPDIKLIFIARDPIARIESSFREYHHSGKKYGLECPFALDDTIDRLPEILDNTKYHSRLQEYATHLPKTQILTLLLEDLSADPSAVLETCFRFLGVANSAIEDARRVRNSRSDKYRDTPRLRELRRVPAFGLPLSKMTLDTQDQLVVSLGLREPFPTTPIEWSDALKRKVADHLSEDVRAFLGGLGRPLSVWPRFDALVRESSGDSR